MDKENKLILYKDDEGKVNVNVRFADEDVWLTQQQLADIYCTTKQNVSQHIDNILTDGELDENLTVKNFLTVRQEGKRQVQREILHNKDSPLCVIICAFAFSITPCALKITSIAPARKTVHGTEYVAHAWRITELKGNKLPACLREVEWKNE